MDNQPYLEPPPRRHGIPILKIIGTILLIMVLICGGLVTYVAYNFRNWTAALARGPMVSMIDQANLPAEQKALLKENIMRVADRYQEGRLSHSQLSAILKNLAKGPFFHLLWIEATRYEYTALHTTMDAERQQTMLLFDRFERGIVEKQIPLSKADEVFNLAPKDKKLGEQRAKHDPTEQKPRPTTEADLKPMLDAMRAAVDKVGVLARPFQPDFAAEVDKAVNAVLGAVSTKPAATLPAESMPQ
jgi:hypothetical protein